MSPATKSSAIKHISNDGSVGVGDRSKVPPKSNLKPGYLPEMLKETPSEGVLITTSSTAVTAVSRQSIIDGGKDDFFKVGSCVDDQPSSSVTA